MPELEPVGVEAQIQGLDEFTSGMASMDEAIASLQGPIDDAQSSFGDLGDAISGVDTSALAGDAETTAAALDGVAGSAGDAGGGIENFAESADASDGPLGGLISSLVDVKAGLDMVQQGLGYAQQAFDATVGAYLEWGGMVDDIAAITGASAEEVSGLAGALTLLGEDTSILNPILRYFSMHSEEVAKKLEAVGIEAHNADGSMRTFMEILPAVADLFNSMPAGPERTALMMELFGRQATALFDVLEKGGDGIRNLTRDAKDLGMVLSDEAAQGAEDLQQAWGRVNAQWEQTRRNLGGQFIPGLTQLTGVAQDLTGNTLSLWDKFVLLSATLQDFQDPAFRAATGMTHLEMAQKGINDRMNEGVSATANAIAGLVGYTAGVIATGSATVQWNAQGNQVIETGGALADVINGFLNPALEQSAADTFEWSAATQAAIDAGNEMARVSASIAYALPSPISGVDVTGLEGVRSTIAATAAAYDSLGTAGVSAWSQIQQRQEQAMIAQQEAAQIAAQDIEWWYQDQSEFIADNAAKLTEGLKLEFENRTAAARGEADRVKETNAQLAMDLLSAESQYQRDKLAIMTDPKLTEEERAAKLAILDRENGEAIQRLKARAELEAKIEQERWNREVAMMQAAGSAGGKSFADEVNKGIEQILLKMQLIGLISAEQADKVSGELTRSFKEVDGQVVGITQGLTDVTGKTWVVSITSDGVVAREVGNVMDDLHEATEREWMITVKVEADLPPELRHGRSAVLQNDLEELDIWTKGHPIRVGIEPAGATTGQGFAEYGAKSGEDFARFFRDAAVTIGQGFEEYGDAAGKDFWRGFERGFEESPWAPGKGGKGKGGGATIGQGLISENLATLLGFGGGLGGPASFFGGLFQKQKIDPLIARAEELAQQIEDMNAALGDTKNQYEYYWLQQQIAATEEERAGILEEVAKREAELQKLEEARQQLEYMDQQMKLLEMIQEYGLNPEDILQGLQLGAGADIEGLLAAITRAMQAAASQAAMLFPGGEEGGYEEGEGGGRINALLPGTQNAGVILNLGPVNIYDEMDFELFKQQVYEVVCEALP